MGKPNPLHRPIRCTAHRKGSGEPCGNWAIRGGNVCRMHGGGSPAVRRRAAERLNEATYALAGMLLDIATSATSEAVRLAAIRDALDRAGVTSKLEISVEVAPWEKGIESILIDAGPEDPPAIETGDPDDPIDAEWEEEPEEGWDDEPDQTEPAHLSSKPPIRLDPDGLVRHEARRSGT